MARYSSIKSKKVAPKEIVLFNELTGEITKSNSNQKINIETTTDKITINSTNYLYLDIDSLEYLILKGIRLQNLGLLLILSKFIEKGSNRLILDGKPLKTKDIAIMIKHTPQNTNLMLKSLIQTNVITKDKGELFLNPYLFRKGKQYEQSINKKFNVLPPKKQIDLTPKPANLSEKIKKFQENK